MDRVALILSLGTVFVCTSFAQETPSVSFNIGAGFTEPKGITGKRLDRGWNIQGGLGANFIPHVGALVQFNYNQFGVNTTTLNNLGFPDGDVRLWSLTLNPVFHLNPKGPVDPYIIGGGGVYHRTYEFTRPSVAFFTGFDPFFGIFYPAAVPANEVLASYSVMKPGVNIGAGLNFGTRWRAKFYAEARYHRMFLRDRHTDMIPVNFGVRW